MELKGKPNKTRLNKLKMSGLLKSLKQMNNIYHLGDVLGKVKNGKKTTNKEIRLLQSASNTYNAYQNRFEEPVEHIHVYENINNNNNNNESYHRSSNRTNVACKGCVISGGYVNIKGVGKRKVRSYKNGNKYVIVNGHKKRL